MKLRLYYRKKISGKTENVIDHFEEFLSNKKVKYQGWVAGDQALLELPDGEKRFWSPRLDIYIIAEENGTVVKGKFGPNAVMWTLIMFFYFLFTFTGLVGLIWGLTQNSLNQAPNAFWLIPLSLLLIGGVYAAARLGQHLGREQTEKLRALLEKILSS